MNKYKAQKISVDGQTFDSRKEARRYCELRVLERCGQISDLQRQVRFRLIDAQRVDGKVVERPCDYIADFSYVENGKQVVEDVKGYKQGGAYALFRVKKKLMLARYGIIVEEV